MAENGYGIGLSSLICTADILVEIPVCARDLSRSAGTPYWTVLAHFMHCSYDMHSAQWHPQH